MQIVKIKSIKEDAPIEQCINMEMNRKSETYMTKCHVTGFRLMEVLEQLSPKNTDMRGRRKKYERKNNSSEYSELWFLTLG